jgi:hypothetical protein
VRKPSKAVALALIVGGAIFGSAGIAAADSGTFVKNGDGSIVFYPFTSGNARGNDFHVSGSQKVCADGPTSALQTFTTHYQQNRTLQPDLTLETLGKSYADPFACSGSFTASSGNTYHLDITWSQASGASSAVNGVTEHSP